MNTQVNPYNEHNYYFTHLLSSNMGIVDPWRYHFKHEHIFVVSDEQVCNKSILTLKKIISLLSIMF